MHKRKSQSSNNNNNNNNKNKKKKKEDKEVPRKSLDLMDFWNILNAKERVRVGSATFRCYSTGKASSDSHPQREKQWSPWYAMTV